MSQQVVLRACAKINLTLSVGGVRPDGFHDVHTLLQSIALTDKLTIAERRGPFVLATRAPGVPTDRTNLVWRAAEALWRAIGRDGDPRDAHVRLEKGIPVAAGLGGGSADAAAALVGLNVVWRANQSLASLVKLATVLGSDVPFFLLGGTAIGAGRGDEIFPLDDITRLGVVVIKPSFGVATVEAYRWLDEDRRAGIADEAPARAVDVGWSHRTLALGNDLQGPVARRHPEITEMIDACYRHGAISAAMTGSGSAIFGLFREPTARTAARALARPDWLICLTRTMARAEAGRELGRRPR